VRAGAPGTPFAAPNRRELLAHRRCDAEHASTVRRLCIKDREVLPRWHQDDRGPTNAHRGVHVVAPEGAYARIPVWSGRDHWLAFVVPVAIATHRGLLRQAGISADTFRAWAAVKSGYAQARTGRRCITRPDTVASVMGVTDRHVERCNAVARTIGLEVVILAGRMLTLEESTGARRRGSRQRGLSTEVALTVPTAIRSTVDLVTPTSGSTTTRKTHPKLVSSHGLTADKKEAAPPPPRQQAGQRQRQARQLASDLVRIVPWLRTERPGRLVPALSRFATTEPAWSAQDVAAAINTHTLQTGRGEIREERIRTRPAVLLASILREIDVEGDNPGLATTFDPAPPVPCERSDCDGHGWIELEDRSAAKCPDCPAATRSWRPRDEPGSLDADGEPPF
jgi:hypothetical protein